VEDVTLPRAEWAAVARQLDATSIGEQPSGLRARIARLLADLPRGWGEEACTLTLDPPAAATVRAIVRRGRGLAVDPARSRARAFGVAEAEQIIRDQQAGADGSAYRIEHRAGRSVTVLGRATATPARQVDLAALAARLIAAGASGELVLVDEATGEEVARHRLAAAPDDEAESPGSE
jgi:hypothetical protein